MDLQGYARRYALRNAIWNATNDAVQGAVAGRTQTCPLFLLLRIGCRLLSRPGWLLFSEGPVTSMRKVQHALGEQRRCLRDAGTAGSERGSRLWHCFPSELSIRQA